MAWFGKRKRGPRGSVVHPKRGESIVWLAPVEEVHSITGRVLLVNPVGDDEFNVLQAGGSFGAFGAGDVIALAVDDVDLRVDFSKASK
jgi:hypothetical protein